MKSLLPLMLCLAACGTAPKVPSVGPVTPVDPTDPITHTKPTMPVSPTQPGIGCQGQSVLAIAHRAVTRISPDGTQKTLFTFGPTLSEDNVLLLQWDVRNGYLSALVFLDDPTLGVQYEYLLLGPADQVVFHRVQSEPYNPALYPSDDGSVAVTSGAGWIIHTDGTITQLGSLQPVAGLLSNGNVAVALGMPWDPAAPKSILEPATMKATPLAIAPDPSTGFSAVGGKLVYFSAHNTLVVVDAAGPIELSLPATATPWAQTSTAGGRYVLAVAGTSFVVVDTQQQSIEQVSGPPDMRARYGDWDVSIADDGTAFGDFTDTSGTLSLKSTTDDGATWNGVGAPMTPGTDFGLGEWLHAIAHGDGVLILNLSAGYGDYLNSAQLVNGTASAQVQANGIYLNADLHPGPADLSANGECAATWVQTASQPDVPSFDLMFVDQAHGAVKALTSDSFAQIRF